MTITRSVRSRHRAFHTIEGDGFDVLRAIPSHDYENVGPFIFLDHFGPIAYRPGHAKGASSHPHAGIETLSLLLEGSMRHKDSLGNDSAMTPGDVQWMRAGKGVVHDEQPDVAAMQPGQTTHGVQLWLNMPAASKHQDPAYRHVAAGEIPILPGSAGGVRGRLIAGALAGAVGPIETFGAPLVVHASFDADDRLQAATGHVRELAVYVMLGQARIGDQAIGPGELVRLDQGDDLVIQARGGTELLLVGGDPLDAPIVRHGPFVMNNVEQLHQAVRDYQMGRMGLVAAS
jgi:redox-sensitive bicupin YhaK (pirin superfamily)